MNNKEMLLHYAKSWEEAAEGHEPPDHLSEPLCMRYWRRDLFAKDREGWREFACLGCPVLESTGLRYCEGTPVEAFLKEEDRREWLRASEKTPEEGLIRKNRALECAAYLHNLAEGLDNEQ